MYQYLVLHLYMHPLELYADDELAKILQQGLESGVLIPDDLLGIDADVLAKLHPTSSMDFTVDCRSSRIPPWSSKVTVQEQESVQQAQGDRPARRRGRYVVPLSRTAHGDRVDWFTVLTRANGGVRSPSMNSSKILTAPRRRSRARRWQASAARSADSGRPPNLRHGRGRVREPGRTAAGTGGEPDVRKRRDRRHGAGRGPRSRSTHLCDHCLPLRHHVLGHFAVVTQSAGQPLDHHVYLSDAQGHRKGMQMTVWHRTDVSRHACSWRRVQKKR